MKTLAECKPSEFLSQTNKIRKAVAKWLTDTDILNIRQRMPKLETIPADGTVEEKAAVFARNSERKKEQARKNLTAVLDTMLDDHPQETLDILALCCFVEPKDVDTHKTSEYLDAFARLISDEAVISFFISIMQLGQIDSSTSARA